MFNPSLGLREDIVTMPHLTQYLVMLQHVPKLATVKFNNGSIRATIPMCYQGLEVVAPNYMYCVPVTVSEPVMRKLERIFEGETCTIDNEGRTRDNERHTTLVLLANGI